jgi:hypothetical protein
VTRRLVVPGVIGALAVMLGACAHHAPGPAPAPAAAPGPAATASPTPQPPPPAPPPMAQHGPLWFLRGAVVDARSGKPLENAAVVVLSRHDSVSTVPVRPSIATGADGRFLLDVTAPGEYRIRVAALGYRFRSVMVHIPPDGEVPYRVFRLSPLALAEEIPAGVSPAPQEPHVP